MYVYSSGPVGRQLTLFWSHNFLFMVVGSLFCQYNHNIDCMCIFDLEIVNKIFIDLPIITTNYNTQVCPKEMKEHYD